MHPTAIAGRKLLKLAHCEITSQRFTARICLNKFLHLLRIKIRLIVLLSPSHQSFTYSFQLSLTKAAKHIKMSSVWNLSYLRKENPLHIVHRMLLHCTIPRSKPIGDFQNVQILKDWLNTIENNWWAYTDLDPVAWIWPSVYFGDFVLKFNQRRAKYTRRRAEA